MENHLEVSHKPLEGETRPDTERSRNIDRSRHTHHAEGDETDEGAAAMRRSIPYCTHSRSPVREAQAGAPYGGRL